MNNTDASDYSPLAFGTGIAIGLMLILGLPRATNARPPAAALETEEKTSQREGPGGTRGGPLRECQVPRPHLAEVNARW